MEPREPAEFDPFEQEELPAAIADRVAPASDRGPDDGGAAASSPVAPSGEVTAEFEAISRRWNVVVEELKRTRAVTTAALLAEAEPVRLEGDALVIGFRYSVLRDKWERGENRQRLAAALQGVFGQKLIVRSEVLGESSATGNADAAPREGGSGGTPARSPNAGMTAGRGAADPAASNGEATAASSPARGAANGSGALEGERLLHEVIATFEGQIVEDSRE